MSTVFEQLAQTICERNLIALPEKKHRIWHVTDDAHVLVTAGFVLKFFAHHQSEAKSLITWQQESILYKKMSGQCPIFPAPTLLAAGCSASATSTSQVLDLAFMFGPQCCISDIPYLLLSRAPGLPLKEYTLSFSAWEQLAAQLGFTLARLHWLPIPCTPDRKAGTWWQSGGYVWSSLHGLKLQDGVQVPHGITEEQGPYAAWAPYSAWLQWQRSQLHLQICPMPLQELINAAASFVPADTSQLLPCAGQGGHVTVPSWLHEDLTLNNIIIDHRNPDDLAFQLIDYADGGHGDPLYDLIILHLYTFNGNANLLRSCMDGYVSSWKFENAKSSELRNEPWSAAGGLASFRACCHVLLDVSLLEQACACGVLEGVESLQALQQVLWSTFDEVYA